MIPVVISGGSGTRLWPISRAQFPKQFCNLFEEPLQTMTLQRCAHLGKPVIVTASSLKTLTENSLKELGSPDSTVLYEPDAKNTGPAIAVLCQFLKSNAQKGVIGIFPSDHLIKDQTVFLQAVKFAESLAQNGKVVTLGISPRYPETGYGYIQSGKALGKDKNLNVFSVKKFHEKPDLNKAEEFLRQGGFSWNAGIFVFDIDIMISHFKKFQPTLWKAVESLKKDLSNIEEVYKKLPSISLDYAIMEHLSEDELVCIPCEMGWNDVGSWDAVAAEYGQNQSQSAKVLAEKSENTFVFTQKEKTVALVDVPDLLVVDTEDSLLVVRKGSSQDVKKIVEILSKKDPSVVKSHTFEDRPWGRFEVLRDTEDFKSKVIVINPKSQISYQSHAQREEHWIVTRGQGEVVLDEKVIPVKKGSYVHIPLGAKHRIRNTATEDLRFVEVQLGNYFGEDDIVRYQDDYKRT